jgi:hypothetical protein
MKTLTIALILITSLSSLNAHTCEKYEAQIVATVKTIETDSLTFCKAIVSYENITFYAEHSFCPLDKRDLVETGISFPLQNGHDCEIPEVISGYAYSDNGKIRLD